jgi:hypothetical protein
MNIEEYITYIKQKTPELHITDRKEILRIIIKSGLDSDKIQEKGNGTLIKFKDLSSDTIKQIYDFIKARFIKKMQMLELLTED